MSHLCYAQLKCLRSQGLITTQPHLCQLVEALHVPFLALHVFLTRKATVTVHDEGHVFGHGSSLGDTIADQGVRTLGFKNKQSWSRGLLASFFFYSALNSVS